MKKVGKHHDKYGQRRMTGLEAIYLQKFDKKPHDHYHNPLKVHSSKAKFRNTLNQFVDDPQLLVDDGADISRQNEMSMMVAEKLDKLQKQYISSNSTKRLSALPITSMGFTHIPGSNSVHNGGNGPHSIQYPKSAIGFARRGTHNAGGGGDLGSNSGLTLNPDINELDPVLKGNWMNNNQQRDSSME